MRTQSLTSTRWNQVSRFLAIVILGTGTAFLLLLLIPLIKPNGELLEAYTKQSLPIHSIVMAIVIGAALGVILLGSVGKAWRSLKLGLVPFSSTILFLCILIFWLSVESHLLWLAIAAIAGPGIIALLFNALRNAEQHQRQAREDFETDLPLPENGRDLLGRGETVDTVVTKILLECPPIMAITGPYGQGKTSFLNLVLGKLRKSDETECPIIVKYNPWLSADPNNLVLSLLNSIIVEMRRNYFIPGLKRDALEYARTLLSAIPQLDRLKTLLEVPSQEEQIAKLAQRISGTDRHIVVVLDDLDRLQSSELETVFKVLRGSDAFVNLTFVCCFDRNELVQILRATRPYQNIDVFIEKFLQSMVPLPEIDSAHLSDLFSQKINVLMHRHNLSGFDRQKTITEFWEKGGATYFQNLRRIKLFLSRIDHSLARIGTEVNFQDFIRLELVRDVAPTIYEVIYNNPEYFYEGDLAFEIRFTGTLPLDEKQAKRQREEFYRKMIEALPEDRRYVSKILEELFPSFAEYSRKVSPRSEDSPTVEKAKRIFHPRCFRQYFMLKVPSELFSQKDFDTFLSSIRNASEEITIAKFNGVFRSIEKEDFKRWHFAHRIDNIFDTFDLTTARGLCRGLVQHSHLWVSDAFEFMICVRRTITTISKMSDVSEREKFLLLLVKESTSMLLSLLLIEWLQKEAANELPSNLQPIHDSLKDKMRRHYLVPDAPSVFEEFTTDLGRIEPIQLLFGWRRLGQDAASDQQKYLNDLLVRRPADLNWVLTSMFRIDFMDDYTALKPLFDYGTLAKLIDQNADILDKSKVQAFRKRYEAERIETL